MYRFVIFTFVCLHSQADWLEKLVLTAQMEPSESVKKSSLQGSSSMTRPSMPPPAPPENNVHHEEPFYANVGGPETENNHHHHQDNDHDTSYSSSEVDTKEKRGRLSKFLGLKPKISTS